MTGAELRDRYEAGLPTLPPHMVEGVKRYVEFGGEPGGFLSSMIRRGVDDAETWARADMLNKAAIKHGIWADWFNRHMPPMSFGSDLKFKTWIRMGGFSGMAE